MTKSKSFPLALALIALALPAAADPVQFSDTSEKLGFVRGTETWGIAWGNLNLDKWPDLWNSGHRDFTRLYRNTGTGDFEDVAAEYDAQMSDWWMIRTQRDVHGGAWGDFDKDGDDDMIVGDENEFFINNAESGGYFTRSTTTTQQAFSAWIPSPDGTTLVSETDCRGNYIQFIDANNDGTLDKICADADVFPDARSDAATSLIPQISNVSDTIVGDFNNDLLQDIIAVRGAIRPIGASKVGINAIDAWFREGTGAAFTFSAPGKVTFLIDGAGGGVYLEANILTLDTEGLNSGSARGIEVSYDSGSGLWTVLDNYSGSRDQHHVRVRAENPVSDPVMTGQENRDLPVGVSHAVNNGSGFDWVYNTGLTTPVLCTSITTADFDNDMDLDLYAACGNGVENTPNIYYDNQGDGSFVAVADHGGEGPVGSGNDFGVAESVAAADYDVDGFMDLAVANGALFYPFGHGGPDTLLRNQGNENHWILIDLRGVTSNANGMFAKVFVTTDGFTQMRVQNGGYHRWSQDHQRIHVGLGPHTVVDEVRIEWPSGQIDVYNEVAADQLYDAVEAASLAPAMPGPPVLTEMEPDQECGVPEYRSSFGPVIQLWRDCGTDFWRLRIRSGLGRLTEDVPLSVTGSLLADTGFETVNGANFKPSDILSEEFGVLDFSVTVRDVSDAVKTIGFSTSGHSRTCLRLDSSDIEPVIIGADGKRLDPPFDITNGFGPCDTDGDGETDDIDTDDDGDSVDDTVDAFPYDPSESVDSDGDGVGDNADLFPGDPGEWSDFDGDGIGDNADIDADNDGVPDSAESAVGQLVSVTSPLFEIPPDGGSANHVIDLSSTGAVIGQTVGVSGLTADGDLNSSNETFTLDFNSGEFVTGRQRTRVECNGSLLPAGNVSGNVTVVDIGGGKPGITIFAQNTAAVGAICSGLAAQYQLSVLLPATSTLNQDGDAVSNPFDLDSDNDTIADIVEAGLVDSDNDFLIDGVGQEGSVSIPPDTDADGIPDYLDLESGNPLNDGTAYDISLTANAALDTSGDGFLSAADMGGGVDADADGIDDLIDRDTANPGSGFDNTLPEALDDNVVTTVDTPVMFSLQGSDAEGQMLSFFITDFPDNGILDGTAPDLTYTPDPGYIGSDSLIFVVNDGYDDSAPATVALLVNDDDVPLVDWLAATGGVTAAGNQVSYSGAPTGWLSNTVTSVPLSGLGFNDKFEVKLTIDSDPAGTLWVAGLGVDESSAKWTDVDYSLRSSNGQLTIYENGSWRTNGPVLAMGDVISIFVDGGSIEYRHNGVAVFNSTYSGTPDFYVDTSFKSGAIAFSASIAGDPDPVVPPVETPIGNWQGETGGVSATGNSISYSGSPTGWVNTVYSDPLSSLGVGSDYTVSWTIDSDPAGTLWIVGLGVTEISTRWDDVDYGLRSSNGQLTVRENGSWRASGPLLAQGDLLAIRVNGTQLQYLHNGAIVYSTSIAGTEDFYIDTSFKSGAVNLGSFTVTE